MKQQIIQISNIELTEAANIPKLRDATQTYMYEHLRRTTDFVSDHEMQEAGHRGYILAMLFHHYEFTYDIERITPNDVRYQEAADEIATYVETDWCVDDADAAQSGDYDLLDETYDFEHDSTLYMYFDDWLQHGYESFLGVHVWDEAFHQVIYEYMRRFLTIKIN